MAAVDYGSHIVFDSSTSVTEQFKIMSVRWSGVTTLAHVCEIYTNSTELLWHSKAAFANFTDGWVWKNKMCNGITTTFDSGTLIIYKDPA